MNERKIHQKRTLLRKNLVNEKGFTLIELLVVIAIIGILAAISLFGISGVFENSRDTQRKSDLNQYQKALGKYASEHEGLYPYIYNGSIDDLCSGLSLTACPNDPNYDASTGESYYIYQVPLNASNPDNSPDYYLAVKLESKNFYWIVCSSGKTGEYFGDAMLGDSCPLP